MTNAWSLASISENCTNLSACITEIVFMRKFAAQSFGSLKFCKSALKSVGVSYLEMFQKRMFSFQSQKVKIVLWPSRNSIYIFTCRFEVWITWIPCTATISVPCFVCLQNGCFLFNASELGRAFCAQLSPT